MTKKTKTVSRRRSLLRDVRGASEMTQAIILTVAVALGALAAFQGLRDQVVAKAEQAGTTIQGIQ